MRVAASVPDKQAQNNTLLCAECSACTHTQTHWLMLEAIPILLGSFWFYTSTRLLLYIYSNVLYYTRMQLLRCLDSIVQCEMQGSDVSVHAMLKKLYTTGRHNLRIYDQRCLCLAAGMHHRRETHCRCQAVVDSPSTSSVSRCRKFDSSRDP